MLGVCLMMERSTLSPCLTSAARVSQVLMYFIKVRAASLSPEDLAARANLLNSSLIKLLRDLSCL